LDIIHGELLVLWQEAVIVWYELEMQVLGDDGGRTKKLLEWINHVRRE